MLKRPPPNRVDAPIVFVHPDDPAWDKERIDAEMEALGPRQHEHPIVRYIGGWTRYDLDAQTTYEGKVVTAREYLDETKQPTMWTLRRLTHEEWYEVRPMVDRSYQLGELRQVQAFVRACGYGLKKVDNGPDLELPGGRPSRKDMALLHEMGQVQNPPVDLIYAIGEAVFQASMPLTETEGKH